MVPARVCCLVVLFILAARGSGDSPSFAQTPERDQIAAEVTRYNNLVLRYRAGEAVADELLTFGRNRLERLMEAIGGPRDGSRPWTSSRVKAAAMLHTEAAVQAFDQSAEAGLLHIDFASRMLRHGGPEVHAFAQAWYAAAARLLRLMRRIPAADQLLAAGREQLPRPAVVLYESGLLQEQLASFAGPAPRDAGDPQAGSIIRGDESKRVSEQHAAVLHRAAALYEESLRIDPANDLCRLHLGRVQTLRGNTNAGVRLLDGIAKDTADDTIAYLALLFTGAAYERLDRPGDAHAAYRSAIDRHAKGHAAHIALSRVLQQQGHETEARTILAAILPTSRAADDEPWWWYLKDRPSQVEARLTALRAEARR